MMVGLGRPETVQLNVAVLGDVTTWDEGYSVMLAPTVTKIIKQHALHEYATMYILNINDIKFCLLEVAQNLNRDKTVDKVGFLYKKGDMCKFYAPSRNLCF